MHAGIKHPSKNSCCYRARAGVLGHARQESLMRRYTAHQVQTAPGWSRMRAYTCAKVIETVRSRKLPSSAHAYRSYNSPGTASIPTTAMEAALGLLMASCPCSGPPEPFEQRTGSPAGAPSTRLARLPRHSSSRSARGAAPWVSYSIAYPCMRTESLLAAPRTQPQPNLLNSPVLCIYGAQTVYPMMHQIPAEAGTKRHLECSAALR